MYNLNMNGASGGSGLLTLPLPQGENSPTPRTPEIVNSLIAMTNPFESSYRAHAPRIASSPPGGSDTSTSSSGSLGCVSPPSVQHTCSQLIKEGLKLTIQSKRRHGAPPQDPKIPRRDEVSADFDDDSGPLSPGDGLTPEDEERRRRRRERNKIAATKCRLKKRERTVNLVQESEILENQNHDLKSQIQELETQRRRLVDMLSVHRPTCTKPQHTFSTTEPYSAAFSRETGSTVFRRMSSNFTRPAVSTSVVDATMTYHRVESCVEPYRRMDTVLEESSYCRPSVESTIYHNFDSQEVKNSTVLVPFSRVSVSTDDTPPSFTRIPDQYSCQNLTDLDQFVKPELPPMATFHSSGSSYVRPTSLDVGSPLPAEFDSVNSSGLLTATYRQFSDENDSFNDEFSSSGLDRSCIV